MKIAIVTAMALAATLVLGQPASADVPEQPTIEYPVYRSDAAPVEGDTVMQLEAPGRAWGIRRSARLIDAQVPGLTVRTSGTCAENPTAVCITVQVGTYNPAQQAAITHDTALQWQGVCICGADGARTILLNRYRYPGVLLNGWFKRMVATHELGHALGLGHHTSKGATATVFNYDNGDLSPAEAAVVADWFAVPRYRPQVEG